MIRQPIELTRPERIGDDPGFDEVAVRTFKRALFGMVRSGVETGQVHPAAASRAAQPLDRHQQKLRQ